MGQFSGHADRLEDALSLGSPSSHQHTSWKPGRQASAALRRLQQDTCLFTYLIDLKFDDKPEGTTGTLHARQKGR